MGYAQGDMGSKPASVAVGPGAIRLESSPLRVVGVGAVLVARERSEYVTGMVIPGWES